MSHYTQSKVTILRLIAFVSPLMFVLGIQRFTRPMVNLLVARFSADKCEAATSVAVLTASYPLGHIAYGWINQVRPVPPAFQKVYIKIDVNGMKNLWCSSTVWWLYYVREANLMNSFKFQDSVVSFFAEKLK